VRPCLEKTYRKQGWWSASSGESACLASVRPSIQIQVLLKNKKRSLQKTGRSADGENGEGFLNPLPWYSSIHWVLGGGSWVDRVGGCVLWLQRYKVFDLPGEITWQQKQTRIS
jgi:hypothetical protein